MIESFKGKTPKVHETAFISVPAKIKGEVPGIACPI